MRDEQNNKIRDNQQEPTITQFDHDETREQIPAPPDIVIEN